MLSASKAFFQGCPSALPNESRKAPVGLIHARKIGIADEDDGTPVCRHCASTAPQALLRWSIAG